MTDFNAFCSLLQHNPGFVTDGSGLFVKNLFGA